jgi:hypothetical protein
LFLQNNSTDDIIQVYNGRSGSSQLRSGRHLGAAQSLLGKSKKLINIEMKCHLKINNQIISDSDPRQVLDEPARRRLVQNISHTLCHTTPTIQQRAIAMFSKVFID